MPKYNNIDKTNYNVRKTITLDQLSVDMIEKFMDKNKLDFSSAVRMIINNCLNKENNYE